jgi:long-chain fatty acid transport protein
MLVGSASRDGLIQRFTIFDGGFMEHINSRRGRKAACCLIACTAAGVHAAGYKLPESSSNATALSAAYVANASGPDASYYNPAAMALDEGGAAISADLTLVHLPRISFEDNSGSPLSRSDKSQIENIPVPTLHYMSPKVGNARFGLSVVTPGGLSKRWEGPGAWSAEEFTLRTVEINPTVGYRLSDTLAVGGGVRMVYSDGVVKSRIPVGTPGLTPAFRDMTGDSIDFGYNLAVHLQPNDQFAFAATYRSKIDLTVEGDAKLGVGPATLYDGPASVEVPLPAALALASAFKLRRDTTLEVVFERTYWSDYKELDFDYAVSNPLGGAFDAPVPKNWSDSNTLRLGLTHELDEQWTLMAGFALDESPAPKRTIGYELPESDGKILSFGARYKASKTLELAGGVLYTKREDLNLQASDLNDSGLVGTFSDAGALLVTLGAQYNFL